MGLGHCSGQLCHLPQLFCTSAHDNSDSTGQNSITVLAQKQLVMTEEITSWTFASSARLGIEVL